MDVQQTQKQVAYSQYSINETHNLVVQNIVKNQQIKFIKFHKLDHMKIMYQQGEQYRFLSGLVAAGRNFIKLYAIFSNQLFQQLACYNIYEDITAVYSWERCIVIQTKHKVVGLIYEDSILKNAFMLSLQFLPLTQKDFCKCAFDKNGLLFVVSIKNFLLICFSDSIIARYKSKPIYKQFSQIVADDIKWNRPQKNYIQEVVKIKISDFELSRMENINICNESLYFIGLKNFEKPNQKGQFNQQAFYHIQTPFLFIEKKDPICQFLAKKDNQVLCMIPYVYKKQMQCLFCKKDSIYVQISRQMVLVDQFQDQNYRIIHRNSNENFSLWVKTGNSIKVYYRAGNSFVSKVIVFNFYFNNFLLKQQFLHDQGAIIYSNQTQLAILKVDLSFVKKLVSKGGNDIQEQISLNKKNSLLLHKSFGNIVDFQFSKNSFFMIESRKQTEQSNQTKLQIKSKLYEIRRSLTTDPKPYITHGKKNFLEQVLNKQKLKSIKSFKFRYRQIGQNISFSDNIVVTQTNLASNRFVFYRQLFNQTSKQNFHKENLGFEKVLQSISFYGKVTYLSKDYLVLININNQIFVQSQSHFEESNPLSSQVKKTLLTDFKPKEKWQNNLFFIQNYFVYQVGSQNNWIFRFFDIFSHLHFDIQLPASKPVVRMFATKKKGSFKKKEKNICVIQLTFILKDVIEVYEVYVQTREVNISYRCQKISKGLPLLTNYIHNVQDSQSLSKDRLRSITCPEYVLSEYHTNLKQLYIKNSYIYNFRHVTLLILINSLNELMTYRKCMSYQSQIGYVYKRVVTPLNIIKTFKFIEDENSIQQIGEGILKICNVIICQEQFLQHNVAHISLFQMDSSLWTIQRQKIKMIDLKPLAGSNQPLFRQSLRKDSKDFAYGDIPRSNTLQDSIEIMSNFIVTPVRTMMRKQLMGIQLSGDYFILYSKSGFQVINQKDMKPVWTCNLSAQSPDRKEVIINVKAYDHYIALSYYDYILDENTEYKSIKFKFRIYNILSKTKILQKPKSTDEPILHIRPIGSDKILLATSSTLYVYQIKGEKTLQPIRTRNFSKRFALNSFSYIPEVYDEKNKYHKPCYMLFANRFGGLSFFVGKWIQTDMLRQMWYQKIRCNLRNIQLFHYGEQLKALITDQDSNLIVINLKPDTPNQAARADKLADMNVGSKANVLRIRHEQDRKIYACFQDGTIKAISAVKLDNPQISLLDFQQEAFSKQIPFMGGFNLRTSRLLNQKYRTYKYVSRGNMVDCQILEQFFSMTANLKQYICQKSQLRVDQLKSVIRSI